MFVGEEYYPAIFSGNKRSLVCKRDSFNIKTHGSESRSQVK